MRNYYCFRALKLLFYAIAEGAKSIPGHVFAEHAKRRFYLLYSVAELVETRYQTGAHNHAVVVARYRAAAVYKRNFFHMLFPYM